MQWPNFCYIISTSKSTLRGLRARLCHDFASLSDQNDIHFRQFQMFLSQNGMKIANDEKKMWKDESFWMLRSIWRSYDVLHDSFTVAFSMPLLEWRKIIYILPTLDVNMTFQLTSFKSTVRLRARCEALPRCVLLGGDHCSKTMKYHLYTFFQV